MKKLRKLFRFNPNATPWLTARWTWYHMLMGGLVGGSIVHTYHTRPTATLVGTIALWLVYFGIMALLERKAVKNGRKWWTMVDEAHYMNKLWDGGIDVQDGFDIKTFDITTHEGRAAK